MSDFFDERIPDDWTPPSGLTDLFGLAVWSEQQFGKEAQLGPLVASPEEKTP